VAVHWWGAGVAEAAVGVCWAGDLGTGEVPCVARVVRARAPGTRCRCQMLHACMSAVACGAKAACRRAGRWLKLRSGLLVVGGVTNSGLLGARGPGDSPPRGAGCVVGRGFGGLCRGPASRPSGSGPTPDPHIAYSRFVIDSRLPAPVRPHALCGLVCSGTSACGRLWLG
jgi:hypothetical protein